MRTRIPALLLPLLTLAGIGAACGGDETLSAAEYREAANRICREGDERVEALTADLEEQFGDEEPSPDELREALEPLFEETREQIAEVRDLEGPSDLEGDVDAVLDDADQALSDLEEKVQDDPLAAISTEEDPFAEVNEQLAQLGLDDCAD